MPDFEALRAERNRQVQEAINKLCDKHRWPRKDVSTTHDPNACYCACPDGPCEHNFDGWHEYVDSDGCGVGTAVCSRCGSSAMSHDLRVMP